MGESLYGSGFDATIAKGSLDDWRPWPTHTEAAVKFPASGNFSGNFVKSWPPVPSSWDRGRHPRAGGGHREATKGVRARRPRSQKNNPPWCREKSREFCKKAGADSGDLSGKISVRNGPKLIGGIERIRTCGSLFQQDAALRRKPPLNSLDGRENTGFHPANRVGVLP
jgi:hypothetical protein